MFENRVIDLEIQVFGLFLELFFIPYRLYPTPKASLLLGGLSTLLIQVKYLLELDMWYLNPFLIFKREVRESLLWKPNDAVPVNVWGD